MKGLRMFLYNNVAVIYPHADLGKVAKMDFVKVMLHLP
jgi:hypothetical protein